jgi:RTX calcium-binding nonapeptide repeat (4 copies)
MRRVLTLTVFTAAFATQILVAVPADAVTVTITEFPIPSGGSPEPIARGPGGSIWFGEPVDDRIGRINLAGVVTEYPLPSPFQEPRGITRGPERTVWFTETGSHLYPVGAKAALVGSATITDPGGTNQAVVDSDAYLHVTGQVSVDSSTPSPRGGPECTIVGTAGDDQLRGTRRDDVICALAGGDDVWGRGGNDTLLLGPGRDSGKGGVGEDVIRGGAGTDDVGFGGYPGNDRMFGGGGIDFLVDWSGLDLLSGGPEHDCLNAGDGEGGDVIRGGGGRDFWSADNGDRVFTVEVEEIACG